MALRMKQIRGLAIALTVPLATFLIIFLTPTQSDGLSRHRSALSWWRFWSVGSSAQAQPVRLRRINPATLSAQIYEQLPDFPLENQYISSESGEVATDNTLVSRFIRYHIYIKDRRTHFRLDWKLTLADYLGAFERMSADSYADYGLSENPMENDVAVVRSLGREERDRLVNTLYETFTAPAEPTPAEPRNSS